MLDWALSVLLGLFALFAAWSASQEPSLLIFVATGCLAVATLLLLPPLWSRDAYKRNVRRAIAALFAAAGLFMPIKTHAVKLDMPKSTAPR